MTDKRPTLSDSDLSALEMEVRYAQYELRKKSRALRNYLIRSAVFLLITLAIYLVLQLIWPPFLWIFAWFVVMFIIDLIRVLIGVQKAKQRLAQWRELNSKSL